MSTLLANEQLGTNVIHRGAQSVQSDFLDVYAAHAGDRVTHYPVDRVLVVCLVGPRPEQAVVEPCGSDQTTFRLLLLHRQEVIPDILDH